ncbi:MAG: MASE3 domain-containing protein, partial [Candidatus Methanoperedens sp.]
MTIKRGILQVAAVIIIVSLAGYLLGLAINGNEASEETLELLAELYSIFISFSIFGVTWYAYSKSRDNHALFMGAAFLVIGFIDLFHTLSYTFMPDFITSNTPGKSAAFWNMARVISAPLLLASAYIFKDSLPALINKPVLSVSAIVISVISLISGVFYHDYMPAAYHEEGISFLRIIQVLATAIIILYAGYLYTRRRTEKNIELLLMYGFIIVVFSDLIYFSYEISGHLLKVAGFYFIYISLYKSSVELPYEKLAIAEEKLRHAAEEKYRNLFDNANDAIIIHDIEGRVISWNNAAEKIFGWTAQEITGKKLVPVIIPPERRVEVERTACSIVPGGLTGFELEFLRKDGSRIDGSLTVSHLRDAGGNVIGVSCIVRDITERKKAEQLRLENERLALANRAKSEFLSVMSHELRTPMNAVIGFSELLKGKMAGELNERQEHFIDNILKSGKRQLSLIEEILDLTLIEA